MNDLLEKATRLAVIAHDGQMRKEAMVPYITHPFQVALILAKHGFADAIIAAGLVHDVVEDTPVTAEELRTELGDEIADMVASVTNDDSLGWEEKKLAYIESVRRGNEGAKVVAAADKIHNARTLIEAHKTQGEEVWKYFNAGKEKKIWFEEKMLEMLQEEWEHALVDEYASLVETLKSLA